MNIRTFLDSTYLKTASQQGISEAENTKIVTQFIQEAITEQFKLIMIRPNYVAFAKKKIEESQSKLLVGTVIDFPKGNATVFDKLVEATQAIENGADDLDFVCNYQAFIEGNTDVVKEEILLGTQLGLAHHKTVKWIIEVAALTDKEIIQLSALIKNVVISNFDEESYSSVFVKSSTGFYKTDNDLPNGATRHTIILMLENASPLPVKAAGGVRTYSEAIEMIQLGVKRIGTSSAKPIVDGKTTGNGY
jgi:deoxyribose-phosphate aldolase